GRVTCRWSREAPRAVSSCRSRAFRVLPRTSPALMTVSCPRCGTRYWLPPRSKLGTNPTYRCVRCRQVFAADAAAEAPALGSDAVPGDDDDTFTFDVAPQRDDTPEPDDTRVPTSRAAGGPPPPVTRPAPFALRTAVG